MATKEAIELLVVVVISYPDKSRRSEAIKRAKECAISTSILGCVSCDAKSAKLIAKKIKNNDN